MMRDSMRCIAVDLIEVKVRSSFEKQGSASAVVDGIVDKSFRRIAMFGKNDV